MFLVVQNKTSVKKGTYDANFEEETFIFDLLDSSSPAGDLTITVQPPPPAAELRKNAVKGFDGLYLKVKAEIWS